MDINVSIPQVACLLVNKLFLKIPVTTGPKTRTEAARVWCDVLRAEGLPVVFDEANGVFVVGPGQVDLESLCDDLAAGKPSMLGDGLVQGDE